MPALTTLMSDSPPKVHFKKILIWKLKLYAFRCYFFYLLAKTALYMQYLFVLIIINKQLLKQ